MPKGSCFIHNVIILNLIFVLKTDIRINLPFCLQEMIDEADRDGDGEINEPEFLRIMKKTSLY